jgi:hypothetical protein
MTLFKPMILGKPVLSFVRRVPFTRGRWFLDRLVERAVAPHGTRVASIFDCRMVLDLRAGVKFFPEMD